MTRTRGLPLKFLRWSIGTDCFAMLKKLLGRRETVQNILVKVEDATQPIQLCVCVCVNVTFDIDNPIFVNKTKTRYRTPIKVLALPTTIFS